MIKLILGSSATENITLSKSSRAYKRGLTYSCLFHIPAFRFSKGRRLSSRESLCEARKQSSKGRRAAVQAGRLAVPHLAAALQGLQLPPPLRLAVVPQVFFVPTQPFEKKAVRLPSY